MQYLHSPTNDLTTFSIAKQNDNSYIETSVRKLQWFPEKITDLSILATLIFKLCSTRQLITDTFRRFSVIAQKLYKKENSFEFSKVLFISYESTSLEVLEHRVNASRMKISKFY